MSEEEKGSILDSRKGYSGGKGPQMLKVGSTENQGQKEEIIMPNAWLAGPTERRVHARTVAMAVSALVQLLFPAIVTMPFQLLCHKGGIQLEPGCSSK